MATTEIIYSHAILKYSHAVFAVRAIYLYEPIKRNGPLDSFQLHYLTITRVARNISADTVQNSNCVHYCTNDHTCERNRKMTGISGMSRKLEIAICSCIYQAFSIYNLIPI